MLLHDYIDKNLLSEMIDKGYVTRRRHPEFPISIYNYSKSCQFDKVWNDVTVKCRGLVVDDETGEILARPFQKFFNYEELVDMGRENEIPAHLDYVISEKVDGSLGVMFRYKGELYITTKGTFESEQGIHATKILRKKCEENPGLKESFIDGYTYLFEIVYPEDHHCISYGKLDDIILIGVIETETGKDISVREECMRLIEKTDSLVGNNHKEPCLTYAIEYPSSMDWKNIRNIISDKNKEGFVVKFADGFRLKLKYESYWRIHYLRSGLTDRKLIDILEQGYQAVHEMMENIEKNLDEENRITIKRKIIKFTRMFDKIKHIAESEYVPFMKLERDEAEYYKKCTYPHLEFAIYKNKDIAPMIWKIVRENIKEETSEE